MAEALVDASFLVALGYPRDRYHLAAKELSSQSDARLLIPDVVLPEVMYNLHRVGGVPAAVQLGELLTLRATPFVALSPPDFERAIALMRFYSDADLDFVDCCITALAERLNITQIYTFDRRDFSMIRPQHTEYFDLLPP